MLEFKDKLILVTGAGRGIGRAVAFEYASQGAKLIIIDLLDDILQQTAEAMRMKGYVVHDFQCDLASDNAVASLGIRIRKDIGLPDILHNNAFFSTSGTIENIDLDAIRKAFEVNVLGYLRIVKVFVSQMIERKSGWIVNTASPNGIAPPLQFAENGIPYNLCKAADISISQSMAATLKQYGIGVTVLYPGAVATEASKKISGKYVKPEYEAALRKFFLAQAVSPEVAARDLVEGIRQEKFFCFNVQKFW